jgi:energy-coupling factor transport system ATP-binding protein
MARAIIKEVRRQSIGRYRGNLVPTRVVPTRGTTTMPRIDLPATSIEVVTLVGGRVRNPLIDLQHVTYTYPGQRKGKSEVEATHALEDVSLQVQQGEYLVILGHNGSGKSTLARHCNALLLPDSGRVVVAGMNTHDSATRRTIRDMVGMIFQNPDNQIIANVVEDDVAWALTVRGLSASLIRERVEYAMGAVGISHLRGLAPHRLSGGQRQRLAIAGVLALRPQCIIADEATAQLDPLSRTEIVALLHQLNAVYGLTIIQVTHLLEEAALAQRIGVMEQGQIVMEGTPANIFADLERLRRLKLAIPEPIELATRLRDAGLPISREALTVEAIAREIVH